jgi:preprotein translocase subunit SecA
LERKEVIKGQAVNPKKKTGKSEKALPVKEDVGRNALCPSAAVKYKNCHGN